MKEMFDTKTNKITLRKKFEARTWQPSDSFTAYHDKIIVSNTIDIVVDYIIATGQTSQKILTNF